MKITLDEIAAENGAKKTHDQWVASWDNLEDGRVMASLGDIYTDFKQIKEMHEQGSASERAKAEALRVAYQDDFDWPNKQNWLIAATRPIYEEEGLDARIIHHFGCKIKELVKEIKVKVPVYLGIPIETVVSSDDGIVFMQAFADTKDDGETIMQTYEFISGKLRKDIKIWTPPIKDGTGYTIRKAMLERASGFYYDFGGFRVGGSGDLNGDGRSRGVRYSAEGAALEKGAIGLSLPYELKSAIDKKANCVHFSNIQEIEDLARYSALFCFKGKRFVLSLTIPQEPDIDSLDKRTGSLLAQDTSSKEKLSQLYQEFSPLYAHLLKYEQKDSGFVLADDIEAFGNPRVKETKK